MPRAADGSQALVDQRFQGLFNSLFKVLCIFRSHYLFAIGLPAVFSLGGGIPTNLPTIPKVGDSWDRTGLVAAQGTVRRDCHPPR